MSVAKLEWDESSDEPYIAVPGFPSVRITLLKRSDAEAMVKLNNIPEIGQYAFRRPYPYLPDDTAFIFNLTFPQYENMLPKLKSVLTAGEPISSLHSLPLVCPCVMVRYSPLGSDGSGSSSPDRLAGLGLEPGELLGNIYTFPADMDPMTTDIPTQIPPQEQEFEMAYDLIPKVWGKGLGYAVIKAILDAWISWVGIGTMKAMAEVRNLGSRGVLRKAGFVEIGRNMEEWPVEKGGGQREVAKHKLVMSERPKT